MTLRLLGLLLAASLIAAMHCSPREEQRTLHVAVAMSLLPAIRDVASLFEERNPGVDVLLNGGASGLLLQQTLRGAPTDLFISASPFELDRLADEGRVADDSRRTIATNRIVILVARGSPIPDDPRELLGPGYSRIAMGNPATAPVGRYARRGLELLEIHRQLEPRLVLAENARQVLEYVVRGEVSAGLLYRSDASILPGRVEVGPELPTDPQKPILYQAAVVGEAVNAGAAEELLELIVSPDGQEILERHGFIPWQSKR